MSVSTQTAADPNTIRTIPTSSNPVNPDRVAQLLAAEWERFAASTPQSAAAYQRALKSLPLGVPSSFQH